MAKRGTLDHPKNKRLARALKTIPAFTLGLLESLWHKVTQFHWNGKVTRLDLEEVFDSVGLLTIYTTDQLIEALTNQDWRWLDPLEDGTWYIHGWHEHCEDSVHAKLYRSAQTFGNGVKPIPKKIGKHELEELEKAWKTQPAAVTPLPAADGSQNPPHGDRRQPALPCLALPCLAKPSPALPGEGAGDFSSEVEQKARTVYSMYGSRRWGKLWKNDDSSEQARRDMRELCNRIQSLPQAGSMLQAYLANPPPGRMASEKLWQIFKFLELETPDAKATARSPPPSTRALPNATEQRLKAQQDGQAIIDQGRPLAEVLKVLSDKYGDDATRSAAKIAKWK